MTMTSMMNDMSPSSQEDVEQMVIEVGSKAREWNDLSTSKKVQLLKQIRKNTERFGDDWIRLGVQARYSGSSSTSKEEEQGKADVIGVSNAHFGSILTALITSLQHAKKQRQPKDKWRPLTNDQSAVTVYPTGMLEQLECIGMLKGELVLSTNNNDDDHDDDTTTGGVAGNGGGLSCILGAGNFNSPLDIVTEMFIHNRVCVYKPNPVNALPFTCMEQNILTPLMDAGYLAICYGGADVGAALTQAPSPKKIVLTGSTSTYNAVVWGSTAEEQRVNQETNTPIVNEYITDEICAELGAVNAWIIVPGKKQWNSKMVDEYARHLASSKLTNNGHTCVSPQIYIVHPQWKYRQQFQTRLKYWLTVYPPTSPPFYPGSLDRQQLYQQTYSQSQLLDTLPNNDNDHTNNASMTMEEGRKQQQQQPLLFIPDVDVTKEDDMILQKEAFAPVLAEVPLPLNNQQEQQDDINDMEFLSQALEFAQKRVKGSLSMTIIANDQLFSQNKERINHLLATMPYGCVGINIWPAFMHPLPRMIWGAATTNNTNNKRHKLSLLSSSGQGHMGNVGGYKGVQKSILRAKFHCLPRQIFWVHKPKRQLLIFQRLSRYKLRPNLFTQALFVSALLVGL